MLGNPNTKISVKSRVSSVARTESTTPSSSSAFSLWDPNYTDPAWINDKVMLIPRLRNWVNTYYEPGTPIGITEYNWAPKVISMESPRRPTFWASSAVRVWTWPHGGPRRIPRRPPTRPSRCIATMMGIGPRSAM